MEVIHQNNRQYISFLVRNTPPIMKNLFLNIISTSLYIEDKLLATQ